LEFTLNSFVSQEAKKKIIVFSANTSAPTAYQNAWVFFLYW